MIVSLPPVITIDGLCGSGKGTVSQLLAKEKGWNLLESGAIYRALALLSKQQNVESDDEEKLKQLADKLDIEFITTSNGLKILLEKQDVTDTIHSQEMGNLSSKVSIFPEVRKALLEKQRSFRIKPGLVADGRDMGTVIFPDARSKIFLTASIEERAKRRYKQLSEKGFSVKLEDIEAEIAERDARDKNRKASPTKPADDAVIIDTTSLTIEEVMREVREAVNKMEI